MAERVEIINKQIIKPSSSTPDHLKQFKLSLLDQLAPVCYGPLLFFYSNFTAQPVSQISDKLKKSLSLTLTHFYPLAGRINHDDASVECNDDGVVFVEAKVNSLLSVFLEKPDAEIIRSFIPVEIESPEAKIGSLVQIQSTFFRCGGFAIGVCVSQKISDAVTATNFIKAWAGAAAGGPGPGHATSPPIINAASVFPPQKFSFRRPAAARMKIKEVYTTKRFVFNSDKIAGLRSRSAGETVRNPTRVEAVTGLIWKCAMNASRSNKDHSRLSIFSQSVNIRRRTVPPLPNQTLGNLAGHFASQATESEIEIGSLVDELRKGLIKFGGNYVKKLNSIEAISESFREAGLMLEEGNIDFYISTSLCRFPFYEIDFGLGTPEWVTIPSGGIKNLIVMLDSKNGDGIEAWVTLTEEDMAFFERDHELVHFACLNPSVNFSNSMMTMISSSL